MKKKKINEPELFTGEYIVFSMVGVVTDISKMYVTLLVGTNNDNAKEIKIPIFCLPRRLKDRIK